jgi:hypothetical protein
VSDDELDRLERVARNCRPLPVASALDLITEVRRLKSLVEPRPAPPEEPTPSLLGDIRTVRDVLPGAATV